MMGVARSLLPLETGGLLSAEGAEDARGTQRNWLRAFARHISSPASPAHPLRPLRLKLISHVMMHQLGAGDAFFQRAKEDIEGGGEEEAEEGHAQHTEEHGNAHGVAHLRAGAR